MYQLQLLASPWWVNLLILVPVIAFFVFRKGLEIPKFQLALLTIWGVVFGFLEAAAVIYLRAAGGLLPGMSTTAVPSANQILIQLDHRLLTVEICREAGTMVMLLSTALLAAKRSRERWAIFLWIFAIWDLIYYLGLWLVIGWPNSITAPDVLFLIPVPWLSQVWFPYLVSGLTLLAVAVNLQTTSNISQTDA